MTNSSRQASGASAVIPSASNCTSEFRTDYSNCAAFNSSYVGEVGLWTGIWLLSVRSLRTPYFPRAAWVLAGVSPLVTWFLLRNVSGVPPLEVFRDLFRFTKSWLTRLCF